MSNTFMDWERDLMMSLLQKADSRLGFTSPNPVTAAAIVKDGVIISEGVHQKSGKPHAEIVAIELAGDLSRGADLYVNLEPCTHVGRTGPCVDAIRTAGIKRVVYAMSDPNPQVHKNRAISILEKEGIVVESGLCAREAVLQNMPFFINQLENRPFVTLKVGSSLDGRIALQNGKSKYITSEDSLKFVHRIRKEVDAILIGVNTLLVDNPSLTIRHGVDDSDKTLLKVILDPNGEWDCSGRIMSQDTSSIIWCVGEDIDISKKSLKGVSCLRFSLDKNSIQWKDLLFVLYAKFNCCHVLIEGGAGVYSSAVESEIIDQFMVFIAPKILGGKNDLNWLNMSGESKLSDCLELACVSYETLGNDCLMKGFHPGIIRLLEPFLSEDK